MQFTGLLTMRLNTIKKDGLFRVVRMQTSNPCIARLMTMGLLPNQTLRLTHEAPLRDPIAIEFNGCHISLRVEDAALIEVEAIK